jgi:hypothetical protein
MIIYLNFTQFFNREGIRDDGSNFTEWYLRLRTTLQHNDALYTIIESLGPPSGEDSDQAVDAAFHDRRDCYTMDQTAIYVMMDPEMRGFWETPIQMKSSVV